MKGVLMPVVSAGSNHAGASEACTAQVSCPSGAAADAGAAISIDETASSTSQREEPVVIAAPLYAEDGGAPPGFEPRATIAKSLKRGCRSRHSRTKKGAEHEALSRTHRGASLVCPRREPRGR